MLRVKFYLPGKKDWRFDILTLLLSVNRLSICLRLRMLRRFVILCSRSKMNCLVRRISNKVSRELVDLSAIPWAKLVAREHNSKRASSAKSQRTKFNFASCKNDQIDWQIHSTRPGTGPPTEDRKEKNGQKPENPKTGRKTCWFVFFKMQSCTACTGFASRSTVLPFATVNVFLVFGHFSSACSF